MVTMGFLRRHINTHTHTHTEQLVSFVSRREASVSLIMYSLGRQAAIVQQLSKQQSLSQNMTAILLHSE